MVQQGFQIYALLPGIVERVFLRLQLRLQAAQNLQVGSELCREFPDMLPFEERILSSCAARP